ncbi:hypothetical protein QLX08_002454 [Tetragonisca angustula]|uniref:Uncharacterized protein n=1 Tax=Tetragonisca angustula TaxID=166442 RepID=A0AAW1AB59_9HYME
MLRRSRYAAALDRDLESGKPEEAAATKSGPIPFDSKAGANTLFFFKRSRNLKSHVREERALVRREVCFSFFRARPRLLESSGF